MLVWMTSFSLFSDCCLRSGHSWPRLFYVQDTTSKYSSVREYFFSLPHNYITSLFCNQVSKFSKAGKVPNHFLKSHEPLHGTYMGVQHSPVRLLINHRAPIYLPLWHSSKPPLPVKLRGVDIVSGNAVNWLECVARGKQVTLKPIARENDDLLSTVLLHLPHPKVTYLTLLYNNISYCM